MSVTVEKQGASTPSEAIPPRTAKARNIQLDFLRGIAILLVLGAHNAVPYTEAGIFRPVFALSERMGWTGVDLFFVLSGYLIGGLLFAEIKKTAALDVKRFIVRRGLRIWPLYYLFLISQTIWFAHHHHTNLVGALHALWANYIHVQNYYLNIYMEHTWSLSVEEHFYLVLPLVLLIMLRKKTAVESLPAVPAIAAGLLVVCLVLRFLVPPSASVIHHRCPTHLRIDSLFVGVLLAYWHRFHTDKFETAVRRYRVPLFIGGFLAIVPSMILSERNWFIETVGYTLLSLGYAALLVAFIVEPEHSSTTKSFWQSRPVAAVAFVGFYSYPIYLFHPSTAAAFQRKLLGHHFLNGHLELRALVATAIYVVLAVAVGSIIGKLIEKPTLLMRDRLFPSRV